MRILLVSRVFWPNIGGIERHVQWLAEALRARGHVANVVTLDRAFEDGRTLPLRGEIGGIEITRVPFRGSTRYPIAPGVLRHVRGYDVVHVHAVDFLADWLVATRPVHGRPVVLSTHGGFFHTAYAQKAKQAWFHTMTRGLVRAVDELIYTSDQDQELFAKLTRRGRIIRNAVDIAPWAALKRQPVAGQSVTMGRIDVHKGLSRLLRTLAAARDRDARPFRHRVLGPCVVDGLLPALIAERDALGLRDHVQFEGMVPIETMYLAVQSAELGLWPAEYESFGISVVESMGAGLPPLMQDNRAFRYFVEGKSGSLTNFGDADRAAADLLRLRDRSDAAEASVASRTKAGQYGWASVIEQIEEVYRRVLVARPHRGGA